MARSQEFARIDEDFMIEPVEKSRKITVCEMCGEAIRNGRRHKLRDGKTIICSVCYEFISARK